jgi:hypothetical protein
MSIQNLQTTHPYIEKALIEYEKCREDEEFASIWTNTLGDFHEWFTDVYLEALREQL